MRIRISKIAQVAIAGLGLAAFGSAQAQLQADNAYTPAGTDIDNIATVNYQLGGVAQELIESSPNGNATPGANNGLATTYDVDRIIDLDVFTQDIEAVSAGYDPTGVAVDNVQYYLTYDVKNLGNDIQDYILTVLNNDTGSVEDIDGGGNEGADDFDAAAHRIFLDNGDGVLGAGDTEITFLDEMAPDETRRVFVTSTIPLVDAGGNPLVDGDYSYITLAAQTADGGGAGAQGDVTVEDNGAETDDGLGTATVADGEDAGDETNIETVFGDAIDLNSNGDGDLVDVGVRDNNNNAAIGNEDGRAADTAAYVIAQLLTVAKVSTVISDPFNGVTDPKRIPGAVIEYTITVTNNAPGGGTTAQQVVITDDVPASTTYVADSVAGDLDGTDQGYTDAANFTAAPGGANNNGQVNSTAVDVPAGGVLTVTFRITID